MKKIQQYIPEKFILRLVLLTMGLFMMALGITVVLKAQLGQSILSAFAFSLAIIFDVKIGTILIYLNILFFIGEILILKKKFPPFQLLQLPANIVFGEVINFFTYEVALFNVITEQVYLVRVLFMILGALILGVAVAFVNHIDMIILPYEAIILLVSRVKAYNYRRLRTIVDITLVSLSLLMAFTFAFTVSPVREGTVFIAIVLGSIIQVSMKFWKKVIPLPSEQ